MGKFEETINMLPAIPVAIVGLKIAGLAAYLIYKYSDKKMTHKHTMEKVKLCLDAVATRDEEEIGRASELLRCISEIDHTENENNDFKAEFCNLLVSIFGSDVPVDKIMTLLDSKEGRDEINQYLGKFMIIPGNNVESSN